MFVEKLTKKQFADYLNTIPKYKNIKESDIDFSDLGIDGYIILWLKIGKKNKTITITDTIIEHTHNITWCKYLYSIFGEEYKNWYKKNLTDEFNEIFSLK